MITKHHLIRRTPSPWQSFAHGLFVFNILWTIHDGNDLAHGTNRFTNPILWTMSSRSLSAAFQSHQTSIRTL
jgi:hypothetical protein